MQAILQVLWRCKLSEWLLSLLHCRAVILLQHSSERLSEDVVSSGVDKRVDAEVDVAESNEDVEPLNRQQSALITSLYIMMIRWRGGATGKAFGLAISRSRVQILLEATPRNNLRQVAAGIIPLGIRAPKINICLHLCASVTKQYNLVPAKGR